MILRVVPVYAAVLALLFVLLSLNVIRLRRAHRIGLGAAGNEALERRIRAHANFAEYAPFTLLLLAMAELRGAPAVFLHVLCLCLLVGRIAHARGISPVAEGARLRFVGMAATFTAIVGAAVLVVLA